MQPGLRTFLTRLAQAAIAILGLAVLAFLLGEPQLEGRNAHATTFEIYFTDPFLAYVYLASIPFFVGLHRAFLLCAHARLGRSVSPEAWEAWRSLRRCALAFLGFVALRVVLVLPFGDREDRPAGLFMSVLVSLPAVITAVVAGRAARKVQRALPRSDCGVA
jgi:hypothetical protein